MTLSEHLSDTAPTPSVEATEPVEHVSEMPSDAAMGRAIVRGSAIGIPLVFAVLVTIELIAGMELWLAAAGAILPAGIFGAFIGSAWCIGRASDAAHAAAQRANAVH